MIRKKRGRKAARGARARLNKRRSTRRSRRSRPRSVTSRKVQRRARPPRKTPFQQGTIARDRIAVEHPETLKTTRGVRVATTRWIGPTKRGYKAVKDMAKKLRKKHPGHVFAYQTEIRYIDRDGNPQRSESFVRGFPTEKALKRERKKGETQTQTFARVMAADINNQAHSLIEFAPDLVPYDDIMELLTDQGIEEITEADMRRVVKEARQVEMKVRVYRVR